MDNKQGEHDLRAVFPSLEATPTSDAERERKDDTREAGETSFSQIEKSGKECRNASGRVRYITLAPNTAGRVVEKPGVWPPEEASSSAEDCAITVKEVKKSTNERDHWELTVESPKLLKLIKEVLGPWTEHTGGQWKNAIPVIRANDLTLMHNWELLEAAAEPRGNTLEDSTRSDLRELLEHFAQISHEHLDLRRGQKEDKQMSWDGLPYLFKPGAEVVMPQAFLDEPQLFIVEHYAASGNHLLSGKDALVVTFWCYDWNGSELVRKKFKREIFSEGRTRPISGLPLYPIEYWPEGEAALRRHLVERGRAFWQICAELAEEKKAATRVRMYDGTLVVNKEIKDDYLGRFGREYFGRFGRENTYWTDKLQTNEEVIVDFKSYQQAGLGPGHSPCGDMLPDSSLLCGCAFCLQGGTWDKRVQALINSGRAKPFLGDEDEALYALFPPRALGYALKQKKWAQFNISDLKPKLWTESEKAWSALQLDGLQKRRIASLVKHHVAMENGTRPVNWVKDVVEQKGEGLVLLFHGLPGVGKTLTAEAIAMKVHRPLLKIGARELNYHNAAQTSRDLETYFRLAKLWSSILLIDEADVFLRDRQELSAEEAALVSEMLKILEYFQGLLIMTTNRVKTTDLAIQSRIHLAIMYPELEESVGKLIWEGYIGQLKDGSNSTTTHIDQIRHWVNNDKDDRGPDGLNGRQIRNIFTLAQILAQDEDGVVTLDHIRTIWLSTLRFNEQLREWSKRKEVDQVVTKGEAKLRRS